MTALAIRVSPPGGIDLASQDWSSAVLVPGGLSRREGDEAALANIGVDPRHVA